MQEDKSWVAIQCSARHNTRFVQVPDYIIVLHIYKCVCEIAFVMRVFVRVCKTGCKVFI